VMDAMQELFVRIGLLNPDGTPSAAFMKAQAEERGTYASQHPVEQQGIWTPDGATPTGSGASSKLWVPD